MLRLYLWHSMAVKLCFHSVDSAKDQESISGKVEKSVGSIAHKYTNV